MEDLQNLSFSQLLERCFLQAGGSGSATSQLKASQDPSLQLLLSLELAARRAAQLSLVNPAEETLREISTGALRSLFIHSLGGRKPVSGLDSKRRRSANGDWQTARCVVQGLVGASDWTEHTEPLADPLRCFLELAAQPQDYPSEHRCATQSSCAALQPKLDE